MDIKKQVKRLTEIGISLSSELNLDALLEKIVLYARDLTSADAGTLYLLSDGRLEFTILQNESLGIFKGGVTGREIELKPVEMNDTSVSAFAALRKKTVRIADVYVSDEFDFTGPRHYDAITGYRSRSMLVVPMMDHEGRVIGVLQLMNALTNEGEVTVFTDGAVALAESLASQAAVSINNARLIKQTRDLFEGLVKVLALAIDAKSKSTRNHIQRVASLNLFLAKVINSRTDGPFSGVKFDEREMEELRLAGWLHDVGKVTTPVWIVEKKNKLETPFDRIEVIRLRFQAAIASLRHSGTGHSEENVLIRELEDDLIFLERCNNPADNMNEESLERLDDIFRKQINIQGKITNLLSEDEKAHLAVKYGNITDLEKEIMRSHVVWTRKMLEMIPFKGYLDNVPLYAAQHHEKLDGSGYPEGLSGDRLSLQSRILAVADVYEALSAPDRSYKKQLSENDVLDLLEKAANEGKLDRSIVDLFCRDKVHREFEKLFQEEKERELKDINDS